MLSQITQQPFPETKLFFQDPEKPIAQKPQRISTVAKEVFTSVIAPRVTWSRLVEKRAIEAHSGALWDCIGRFPANPGFIYEFLEKTDIDQWTEQARIYPAIEICASKLHFLDITNRENVRTMCFGQVLPIEVLDLLNPLGYVIYRDTKTCFFDTKEVYLLTLPDREALLARWEILIAKLKTCSSQLNQSKLNVLESAGVASDEEFIKGYFENDIILSTGKEFVHDHLQHAIPTLIFMISGKSIDYIEVKARFVEVFRKLYQRLVLAETLIDAAMKSETVIEVDSKQISLATLKRNMPKAMAYLSASVDRISTSLRKSQSINTHIESIVCQTKNDDYLAIANLSYAYYLQKRFPWSQYELSTKQIWEAIDFLEASHNATII